MKRVLLFAAALAAASVVFAQGPAEGKWWKRPRIARELALTDEQTGRLEKIFAASKPKLIDLRADLEKKQFDYEQSMQSDDVDRAALEKKIEAREQARASLQKELALMELDMKQVLTAAQRETLSRMRENARAAVQQRRRQMRDSADAELDDVAPPATRAPATPQRRRTP